MMLGCVGLFVADVVVNVVLRRGRWFDRFQVVALVVVVVRVVIRKRRIISSLVLR